MIISQCFYKYGKVIGFILGGVEDEFQGSINLFIVSKESRGLGVGKTLVKYLNEYMNSMDVKFLYLYTYDRCNYGFYDSQGYKLVNKKDVYLNNIKTHLNVFLYRYDF
ncbi:GNAT family N-acetyltransferase [Clostridium sp. CCUG 7971]|uniref:GNAT family N-acetyltransferase n=1 Tax=Clostridium sp. CCUG 7971 TaxID=2811414 RepID=UPI001ABB52FC|nr:GNAT family N-acetyltransferase [Clostridium sp. CCUG 7971]MBO3445288.1 GNAT family N-acetyltransferase [Clostridium sp. CCUG 7971]